MAFAGFLPLSSRGGRNAGPQRIDQANATLVGVYDEMEVMSNWTAANFADKCLICFEFAPGTNIDKLRVVSPAMVPDKNSRQNRAPSRVSSVWEVSPVRQPRFLALPSKCRISVESLRLRHAQQLARRFCLVKIHIRVIF